MSAGGGNAAETPASPDEGQLGNDSPNSNESLEEKRTRQGSDNSYQILDWEHSNDPANPQNFSKTHKWLITGAALIGTLLIPVNGTSITVAAAQIDERFNISDATFANSYWTVTSWSVGGAVLVVLGLPLMEDLGVRLGFLAFYGFFFLMVIPQALAKNFATLIVTRFFSGGCVSLLSNVISSIIPDLFATDEERSLPVSLWILAYLVGYTIGPPIFAGVLKATGDWRWIFYVQLIIYGALFPLFWFLIKETRGSVILGHRARKIRKETGRKVYTTPKVNKASTFERLRRAIYRPLYLEATEPVLFACTLWSGFCVGTVFMFTQSVEQVYHGIYGWDSYQCSYVQIAVVIGEICGWPVSFLGGYLYLQSAPRNTEMPGRPIPEARLYVTIFGSFVGLTGGMFVYAWTSYPSIHWIGPSIGLAMVGFGVQVVVSGLADYIEDAYAASDYAASAVSGIAAAENIVGGFLPLATLQMYRVLGYQWASTILAFVALVLSFIPVVIVWKGRLLRERSPFMLSAGKSFAQE